MFEYQQGFRVGAETLYARVKQNLKASYHSYGMGLFYLLCIYWFIIQKVLF